MPFEFVKTTIPEVQLIKPTRYSDDRGYFMETYKKSEFLKQGIDANFMQDSQSASKRCVVRGMHFQLEPAAQGKLVSAVTGSMFDVAVDIRTNSPYYGKWVSEILSEENGFMLWIPPGFAHGYMSLDDKLVMQYKFTSEYSPDLERGIAWNDPQVGIEWPLDNPISSEKDNAHPMLSELGEVFRYE